MSPRIIGPAVGVVAAVMTIAFFLHAAQDTGGVSGTVPAPGGAGTAGTEIMTTNGEKHTVPLSKIVGGGPPPDGIPSIDDPAFAAAHEADFVSDSDLVIGLNIDGDARAYPLFILVWHEIVNDRVGGTPVAVTYCPLCFTSQVFERLPGGREAEFGTSGRLYNSNLVMYDRLTGTYWSQALGTAIKGELAGSVLDTVPFDVISWGDWKRLYPDTVVLSTDTGHLRPYGTDPYGSYYTDSTIMFPVENDDQRMHPKEIILGFDIGGTYKAYRQDDIESAGAVNDMVGDRAVLLVSFHDGNSRAFDRTSDGQTLSFESMGGFLTDSETGSRWNYEGVAVSGSLEGQQLERLALSPGFWFEWIAFHPETEVYEP